MDSSDRPETSKLVPFKRSSERIATTAEQRFLNFVSEINGVDAREQGAIAYLSSLVVQCNLPYRDPKQSFFERKNGRITLSLQAPPSVGLPYGRYPRLILAWLGLEVVRTGQREIKLGDSLTDFMRGLGVQASGGRNGPLRRFRDQAQRLFTTTFEVTFEDSTDNQVFSGHVGSRVATRHVVWWAKPGVEKPPGVVDGGYVVLSEEFFEELRSHPVPVDYRALQALTSTLALDLYGWLTYRMHSLSRPTTISWSSLAMQFGSGQKALRNFRIEVRQALERVLLVYPQCRAVAKSEGLSLYPSPTHILPASSKSIHS